ncbi:MAG: hypothetical protein H0T51_10445 [Pirellulales bacterium]|nr:hypothetical protein [Pirellulales bacterium]
MAETKAPNDDDDDYELEPLDPEILAIEKARGARRTEAAVEKIDVDELYGDTGNYSDLSVDLSQLKQFRFTTRHLLILTAVLAIVLTLFTLLTPFKAIAVLAFVTLAGGWFYASQLERRQQAERTRRRAEFFRDGDKLAELADESLAAEASRPRFDFKFAFSMKELLITMTVAAVAVGIFTITGGPGVVSMIFGALALAGLIAHAMGFEPPRLVVLSWWLSLMIYLAVGFFQLMKAAG